jgi:CheY-like chemotaxis protein
MPQLRVLLADSDNYFRTSAQRMLTRQGYFVIPAASGADALAHIANDQLDVVVADVALPQYDGRELLRALQAKSKKPPLILLTQPGYITSAAMGVREGAFDYLVKPVDDLTRLALLIDRAAGRFPQVPEDGDGATSSATESARLESTAPPGAADILEDFSSAVSAGQELNHLLNLFAAELAQLARAAHTFVLLAHSDSQLHLVAQHGYSDRMDAARDYVQTIGENFSWRVVAARELTWRSLPIETNGRASTEIQHSFGLPLLYANQVLGVAIAHITPPREAQEPATLSAVQHLAQQAALGVELARLRALVKRLAPTDALTGLFDRLHFFELAEREFRRSWRFAQPIVALHLDIDDFSKLHLILGPSGIDQVVREVGGIIRNCVRAVDLSGRLGVD